VKLAPSTSLVPRPAHALALPATPPHGGRGLLATGTGAISCELEPLEDAGAGPRYELRITNATAASLRATATAIRLDEPRPIAALAVAVAPHAAIRTGFTLDAALAYERVVAEIRGEGVHLLVEAPPPRGGRRRRRWLPALGVAGAAAALAGAALIVFGLERPRVVDAALVAAPGGTLVARWTTAGAGRRWYELRDRSGVVVARGTLPAGRGALPLGRGESGTLRVAISNAFGSDARDAVYARATPPPAIRIAATPPPRIVSLSVDPPKPGAPLTVRYAARAREIRLAIVDRTGATWFRTTAPSGSGLTEVPAPPAGPREPYALIATAEGAGSGEQTRVPIPAALVPATPGPLASAAAPGRQPATTSPTRIVDVGGGGNFTVRPNPVAPGAPFVVEIPFADGARVALIRDRDGAEMAGAALGRGERSAALAAPQGGGKYTVRVTLQRGEGVETLVEPLRIAGS
jgi:hypothetical protein